MQQGPFWIPVAWPGKLAIVLRPRGHDWLEDDIKALQIQQLDVLASLLTASEMNELGLEQESALLEQHGMQFFNLPIADWGVPSSTSRWMEFVHELQALLQSGKNVAIHCRQSVGRSSLLAASLLVSSGLSTDEAFRRIEQARGCPVPETIEQRQWVQQLQAAFNIQNV